MDEDKSKVLQQFTARFVELANTMVEEGETRETVSGALMSASAVYSTYVAAGNEGGLNSSGVDKVAEAYKSTLQRVQDYKKVQTGKS